MPFSLGPAPRRRRRRWPSQPLPHSGSPLLIVVHPLLIVVPSTLAQALAELAAPYNDSAAAAGMSPRLGNVVDSWYFAALGSAPAQAHLILRHLILHA